MELISFSKEKSEQQSKKRYSQSSEEESNWVSKNIKRQSYSNISILTTKYDDVHDKFNTSEKKKLKSNQEDSIIETLKSRGLLNCIIEKKINEYNQSLKRKESSDAMKNNISYKISLLEEYRIIKNNSAICDRRLGNLEDMNQLKNKKLEILEIAKNLLNSKIKFNCLNGKYINFDDDSKNKCKNYSENNGKNDNSDNNNYGAFLVNSIKNVKLDKYINNYNEALVACAENNKKLEEEKLKNVKSIF